MCKCRVELSPDQSHQRTSSRRLMDEAVNDSPQNCYQLGVFCSEPCYQFKARVDSKGLGVTSTSAGVTQLCLIADPEALKIDKKVVAKRNPAAWRRMSKKHGLVNRKSLSHLTIREMPASIDSWLTSLAHTELIEVFKSRQYVDILHIMIGSLTEEDMDYLDIRCRDTRRSLIGAAEVLRNDYMNNMNAYAAAQEVELS